jgi:hypothetical protein
MKNGKKVTFPSSLQGATQGIPSNIGISTCCSSQGSLSGLSEIAFLLVYSLIFFHLPIFLKSKHIVYIIVCKFCDVDGCLLDTCWGTRALHVSNSISFFLFVSVFFSLSFSLCLCLFSFFLSLSLYVSFSLSFLGFLLSALSLFLFLFKQDS